MARLVGGDSYDRAAYEARLVIEASDPLDAVFLEVESQLGIVEAPNQAKTAQMGEGETETDEELMHLRFASGSARDCACCGARLNAYRPKPRRGSRFKQDRCTPCQNHRFGHCPLKSR